MKTINLNRRDFIRLIGLSSFLPFISSCSNSLVSIFDGSSRYQPKPKVDVLIEGNRENIARAVKGQFQRLRSIAENLGKELKVGYETSSGYGVLRFSFVKDGLSDYPHLRLVNENTGEVANIIWGRIGIYPTIKFVDDRGDVIVKDGKSLEFALRSSFLKGVENLPGSPLSARDWLLLGLKIFAVALAIWIGLGVAKIIISALSFLAFNALVIGLLIVALSVVIPFVKWVLEITGIKLDDVVALFNEAVEKIISTLLWIVDYLEGYFRR